MKKNKNKIRVNFSGHNSVEVTGSCAHIEMSKYEILLDCGLYQSNSIKDDYYINSDKFPFKPKNIDFIFISHVHMDHIGRLPALYAQGCTARIICPKGTYKLFTIMGEDSAYIIERDVETLKQRYKMKASPIYSKQDVHTTLKYIEEYDFGEKVKLNNDIEFMFTPAGHIIGSAQTELWLREGNQIKKIIYTGDLGNSIPKLYANHFEPLSKANLVIGETTYSSNIRNVTIKDRQTDIEKLKSVIEETCLQSPRGKVLIPTFSLDRTQNILTLLYDIFKDRRGFDIPVIVDSPLATMITSTYLSLVEPDEQIKLLSAINWDNVVFVDSYEESLYWQKLKKPMVILAASGFMQAGRSKTWAKTILPDCKSHIMFVGFATEKSLAGRIRRRDVKAFSIDGKNYKNACKVTTLHSFSSHIQHDEMLKYYSDMQFEKIALVHGNYKDKCVFAKELQDEINRKNKTGRVIVPNKSTSLLI